MIKLGILDFDTSHVVEFTKRLNHVGIDKEQFVEGAKVVIGCAGESKLSPEIQTAIGPTGPAAEAARSARFVKVDSTMSAA